MKTARKMKIVTVQAIAIVVEDTVGNVDTCCVTDMSDEVHICVKMMFGASDANFEGKAEDLREWCFANGFRYVHKSADIDMMYT